MRKGQYEQLFKKSCEFVGGALNAELLKLPDLPEVAFVGRSNVGKSSLINALVNHKRLAHVSKTPGRTQQINFFNLANILLLVDLPGYGYAKVAHSLSQEWRLHISQYVLNRRNLRAIFVLIDARHGIKDADQEFFNFMKKTGTPLYIVLTKIDKLNTTEQEAICNQIQIQIQEYTSVFPQFILTSSQKNLGLRDLQKQIADFILE